MINEAAPAKVNLFLHVVGRRADGYHLLDSLAVFPPVGDVLHGEISGALSLSVDGPFAAGLHGEDDNLVLRAARALMAKAGTTAGAALTLTKNLPVASGVGGGSADAAAALRLLARLWNIGAADSGLAASLGADVPVCLAARPARMGGTGEILTAAPGMPDCGLVLVNPGVAVATQAVFRARTGEFSLPAALPAFWSDFATMAACLARLRNDLEPAAIHLSPVIGDVLAALRASPGCALARMSGSGATCFGLYADDGEAAGAAASLRRHGWWTWSGMLTGVAATAGAT